MVYNGYQNEKRVMSMFKTHPIVGWIDNERVVFDNNDVTEHVFDTIDVKEINVGNQEYYLFKYTTDAGQAARDYWEDMAENDPREFRCVVGDECLVHWAMNQPFTPGNISVSNLEEWLDLWLDHPEEYWASYDSQEREFKSRHPEFDEYIVCYRRN